jgi:copper transport protein
MLALERNTVGEFGIGLCVILIVGALGTMTPSAHNHSHVTNGPIPSDASFVHIHSERAMAEITIEPGRQGPARATILLMRPDFSLFAAKSVLFAFTPQAPSDPPVISSPAKLLPDGTWEVDKLEISQPGIWIVKLTIAAENLAPFVVQGPIVIER